MTHTRLAVAVMVMLGALCLATYGTPAAYLAGGAVFILTPALATLHREQP
jgi:hypothetical protein